MIQSITRLLSHFSHVWPFVTLNCSLRGSSVHGILQARILKWAAMPSSRGSSWPRDWTRVSCMAGSFFTVWATRKLYIRETDSEVWTLIRHSDWATEDMTCHGYTCKLTTFREPHSGMFPGGITPEVWEGLQRPTMGCAACWHRWSGRAAHCLPCTALFHIHSNSKLKKSQSQVDYIWNY